MRASRFVGVAVCTIALVGCKPTAEAHKAAPSSATLTPTVSAVATPLVSSPVAIASAATVSVPPQTSVVASGGSPPILTDVAVGQLATLAIKGRAPMTGYSRAQFGPAWPIENGCDARNEVLARDLTKTTLQDSCTLETGTLVSPYTVQTIHFVRGPNSAIVQIDHVVALGDAWKTGAQSWTAAKRETFANDPAELLAVDGPSNEQKGDADAASWLPANKPFRCAYIAIQINVKATYGLWVTQAEHDAMARVLASCGPAQAGVVTTPAPAQTTTAKPTAPPPPKVTPTPAKPAPSAGTPLACTATLSDSRPKHNETVDVFVHTAAGAQLTVTAVYKSKSTVHAGSADASGVADVPFDIASASYGFVVDVNVTVSAGASTADCATRFTPTA